VLTRVPVIRYAAVAFGRLCIIDDSDCQVDMISDVELNGHTHFPALVDSGFVDASQLWLWADSLDFESFGQG
jgi:hypothetical protein